MNRCRYLATNRNNDKTVRLRPLSEKTNKLVPVWLLEQLGKYFVGLKVFI